MTKTLLITLLLLSSFYSLAETCEANNQLLQANYTIKENSASTQFQLLRNNNQIAYYYPKKQMTDVWVKYKNNKIALNRYFESAKRSIEYQPTELKRAVNWEKKNQLITHEQIKGMKLITSMGDGCYQQEEYSLENTVEGTEENNTILVRLTWLPQLKLVKRLYVSHNGNEKIWDLHNVDLSSKPVEQFFMNHYQYQSTDYADIGDNESDPFLAKMINLGFVDHASDGFYNSNGEKISGSHHAH